MQKTVLKPLAGAGYVILGAGLDSFALRHAATPSELAVFEVDAPRTQDRKRRRLAELGLELPGNLRFAPCDFEMLEVGKRISAAAGVNFATFFAPDEMAGVLRDAGFAETEHFSPERAQPTYFEGRADGLRAPDAELLMRARTS